jgi:hypothetical protein
MEPLEIIILLGMVVSTLLLWFMQHVNNKVCALTNRLDMFEKKTSESIPKRMNDIILQKNDNQ